MTNSLKKAIQRITTFLASIAILYSCADSQEPVLIKNVPDNSVETESRTIQEAISEADKFLGEIDNNTTRTNARRVGSVECINSNAKTRSSCNDTIMYLINYSGNNGFALVGKSKHSDGIYAISPEGHLEMSDTIENKGLAMFVSAAVEDAAVASIIPIDKPVYIYQETRKITPLLPENIAIWEQTAPYNKYCKIINGVRAHVGCGPLAVGMLCAFYKFPYILANKTINWTAIYNNSTDDIARMLADLGSPEYLNATQTSEGTSIALPSINYFISKVGFNKSNAWLASEFSGIYHEIFDFMKSGKNGVARAPILMAGYRMDKNGEIAGGHAWIVDGFIERIRLPKIHLNNPMAKWTEADPYLHCVWGWNEKYNGYYLYLRDQGKTDEKSKMGTTTGRMYEDLKIWGALSY